LAAGPPIRYNWETPSTRIFWSGRKRVAYANNVCIMCTRRRRPVAMGTLPGRRSRFSCVFDRNVTYTRAAQRCLLFARDPPPPLARPSGGCAGTLYIIIIIIIIIHRRSLPPRCLCRYTATPSRPWRWLWKATARWCRCRNYIILNMPPITCSRRRSVMQ